MVAPKNKIAGAFALFVCMNALGGELMPKSAELPQIENLLKQCVDASVTGLSEERGILVAALSVKEKQPISECGCKSMLSGFHSSAITPDGMVSLLDGRMLLTQAPVQYVPIAAQKQLVADRKLRLTLSCAQPD